MTLLFRSLLQLPNQNGRHMERRSFVSKVTNSRGIGSRLEGIIKHGDAVLCSTVESRIQNVTGASEECSVSFFLP